MIDDDQTQHGGDTGVNKITQREMVTAFEILHDKTDKTEIEEKHDGLFGNVIRHNG